MKLKLKICLSLCIISILLILTLTITNSGITIYNPNVNMTATVVNEIIPYTTTYVYDSLKPSDSDKEIISEGINGLNYTYDGIDYVHLSDMVPQVEKVGTGKSGQYTGKLTGYGPDCPGCSKVGNVSCKTREGTKHSLINDGITYNDSTYGDVRILAADNTLFPCGTIIKIDNGIVDSFYGVVLDTGYSMRNAWKQGNVWIDLAFSSQNDVKSGKTSSSNAKFSVQRWGW